MAQPPTRKPAPRRPRRPAPEASLPVVEVVIERLDEDGIGVARSGGREVLVAGALPGEKVRAAIEHAGQRRSIGRLRQVLAPNPERVTTVCRGAGECLGCPLVCLSYPAQLDFKRERAARALASYPELAQVPVHPAWGAEQRVGYRTNAKLMLAKERGQVRIGLYRRGTHEVSDSGDCPLHHPLINRIVRVVREEIERQQVWVYDPQRQRGLLRYLLIRVSPGANRAMVTFVTSERDYRQVTQLGKGLQRQVPEVVSINQNVNTGSGNVILGRETLRMIGPPDLLDQLGDLRLRIAPTSFFQVNHGQAARIYALVRQWAALTREDTAVDLYCGIGGIALNLARDAGRVVGVEVVAEAVNNAKENARLNGLTNCVFLAGEAEELVQDLAHQVPPGTVAVVNPPRGGCEPAVLKALAELRPRTLIYVSCDPVTLARDLQLLANLGYRTEEVQPVDMFPQTAHVECVARLVPAPERKSGRGRQPVPDRSQPRPPGRKSRS